MEDTGKYRMTQEEAEEIATLGDIKGMAGFLWVVHGKVRWQGAPDLYHVFSADDRCGPVALYDIVEERDHVQQRLAVKASPKGGSPQLLLLHLIDGCAVSARSVDATENNMAREEEAAAGAPSCRPRDEWGPRDGMARDGAPVLGLPEILMGRHSASGGLRVLGNIRGMCRYLGTWGHLVAGFPGSDERFFSEGSGCSLVALRYLGDGATSENILSVKAEPEVFEPDMGPASPQILCLFLVDGEVESARCVDAAEDCAAQEQGLADAGMLGSWFVPA